MDAEKIMRNKALQHSSPLYTFDGKNRLKIDTQVERITKN